MRRYLPSRDAIALALIFALVCLLANADSPYHYAYGY